MSRRLYLRLSHFVREQARLFYLIVYIGYLIRSNDIQLFIAAGDFTIARCARRFIMKMISNASVLGGLNLLHHCFLNEVV